MGCSLGGSGFRAAYSDSAEPISSDVCPTGTMFPAPFKDGAGGVGYLTQRSLHYSIVDKVRVPQEEGEYVLSWRWDCEETNQVSGRHCITARAAASSPRAHMRGRVVSPRVGVELVRGYSRECERATDAAACSRAARAAHTAAGPEAGRQGLQGAGEPNVQGARVRQVHLLWLPEVPRRHDVGV